jgi:acetoin utilization protein AcuB
MFAKQLITDDIIPLKTSDSGAQALAFMDDYKLAHLPIVNNVEYLGMISEDDIFVLNNFDQPLGNHQLSSVNSYVTENQHVFEVLKIIAEQKLTIVPVLDNKNRYQGSITAQNLLEKLASVFSVDQPGGLIILEMSEKDYSLSEISQIVESNHGKVLSLNITSNTDSSMIEVALKLNTKEIQAIIQTFNRYNYNIKASIVESEDFDDLKDRYDSLMNYLEI